TTILTYCFCSHPLGEFPGNGRDGRGEGGQPRLAHRGAGAVGGRRRRDGQRRLLQQRSGVSFVKNIVRVPTLMIYPCESCARSYFVVGSVISAVCSALALYLFVVHGGGGSIAVSLLDAAAQALLFAAGALPVALAASTDALAQAASNSQRQYKDSRELLVVCVTLELIDDAFFALLLND
uniref:CASP-like protein n=1 Tax=Aegilops tauschii subsp. strangulata TaxID=200361 RepID=A0A453M273_AEGTS